MSGTETEAVRSPFDEKLEKTALGLGATHASAIPVDLVETEESFRALCEKNVCGNYGRSWTCPPRVGEIHELMAELREFDRVLVFQTVSDLEDSYDFEGMMEAGERHNRLTDALRAEIRKEPFPKVLTLGAGGCRICQVCAMKTGEECRHPDRALASLEAYGVNVSKLAAASGMKYINGQNTVTYFGAVFYVLPPETEA